MRLKYVTGRLPSECLFTLNQHLVLFYKSYNFYTYKVFKKTFWFQKKSERALHSFFIPVNKNNENVFFFYPRLCLSSDVHFKLVIFSWKREKTSQLKREKQKTRFIVAFYASDVFYLRCPLCAGFGRCCCSVSVWAASCRGSCWVWADSWRRGCRAVWEASESEETSDTAGGTSCRRWFWCLQGAAAEESLLSAYPSSMFLGFVEQKGSSVEK